MARAPKVVLDEIAAIEAEEAAKVSAAAEPAVEPVKTGDPTPPVAVETPAPALVQPTPAPAPAPAVDPKEEARSKTLEGLLRKKGEELKESRAEVSKLQQMLTETLGKMNAMVAQPAPTPAPKEEPPAPGPIITVQPLTEAEDEILGGANGDLANGMRKLVSEVLAASAVPAIEKRMIDSETRIAAIEKTLREAITGVETKVENVVQTQEQRQKNEFMSKLLGRVKNAVEINSSPEFQDWLTRQFDGEFVKEPLWNVYEKALNKDADVIAAIQERFLKDVGGNGNAPTEPAVPAPAPVQTVVQAPVQAPAPAIPEALKDQIALPRSSDAGVPPQKPVKPITMEDINKLQVKAQTLKTKQANDEFEEACKKFELQLATLRNG